MLAMSTRHPSTEELQAYGQGRLAPESAAAVEQHVAACDSCCRLLEEAPVDSFVGQLRHAERAAQATTADAAGGTLTDALALPPELADHPRYRVLGLIGQGGMGAVYKAEHRRMERLVALKVINPGLMRKPAAVERFRQEAKAAARLSHPNIVTAYDADQAGELHFLVMEYVEGRTVADVLREHGPLPVAEACEYIRQAALGLQHAHEQGMVHRDIKPHNLMLSPSPRPSGGEGPGVRGQIKLLDFGLARFARDPAVEPSAGGSAPAGALTGAGVVMGTADYIAPEQAADPRTADIRADIYSLGCTLFHLLTGRPPYPDGGVQDKLAQHATQPLPPLPDVPPALAAVVARMTAKNPAERFATPAEVAEALAPFTRETGFQPAAAHKEAGWNPISRRRLLVAILLLAAGYIVAFVVVRIQTDKGEVVIQTDDPNLEIVTKKGGEIVRIRDVKSGQTWELDTKNLTMRDLEHPDGLALEVPWRGKVTFKSSGGKVVVSAGPPGVPIAKEPEFKPLFNGKDLDGWKTDKAKWTVKDGVIIADRAGELVSERAVAKNFRLRMEIKLKRGVGVVRFRVPAVGERDWNVALMDNRLGMVDGELHTGREIGQESTGLVKTIAKMDEWMLLEITAQDQEATVRINGKQVMYLHNAKYTPAPGHVGLLIVQAADPDNTEMHVRKIEIMALPPGPPASEPDFQPLFNGKDFAGWQDFTGVKDPFKYWSIRDESLVAKPAKDLEKIQLRTVREYENYELQLEYRFVEPKPKLGTASILLHGKDRKAAEPPLFAISLRPDIEPGIIRSYGATHGKWMHQRTIGPKDGWNEVRVEARERSLRVYFNGRPVATADECTPSKGFIGLENVFDGEVLFRKIEIKELTPSLPSRTFQPLFNGKDLTGWTSSADSYFVKKDGNLLANPVPNDYGMLRTTKVYENYELRFQCQLSGHAQAGSKTRAGLALHVTNAESDPTRAQYGVTLSITSGRNWGMTARARGDAGEIKTAEATKPPAEGNWHDVRVVSQNGRVTIFFNGEARWSCSRCPDRTGHIGLWAEDGDVLFHNIEIKELPPAEATRPIRATDPVELAKLPNAADTLKHEDIPEATRAHVSGGDAKKAPPELVAVLGDVAFRCPGWVGPPAFSADGKLLAVPSESKVLLFDAATGLATQSIPSSASRVAFSPDGRILASASGDRLDLWDLENGKRLHRITVEKPQFLMNHLAFSPDSKLIAVGCELSEQVRVWDVRTGRSRFFWDGRDIDLPLQGIDHVAFSADGRLLVAADLNNNVQFWEVPPEGDFKKTTFAKDFSAASRHFAFSPDGKMLAVYNWSEKGAIQVYDVKGKLLHRLEVREGSLLAFGKDSRTLMSIEYGDRKYVVRRWDVASGKSQPDVELAGHGRYRPWALSPDGKTLAVVKDEYDCLVQLIDTETGKPLIQEPGHSQAAYDLAFSPNGKLLASADRHRTKLWDLATGRVVHTWENKSGRPLVFSPDSRMLALRVGKSSIELRGTEDGRLLHSLRGPEEWITEVAFSPDGKRIAAGGCFDPSIWIWRTDDGKKEQVLDQKGETYALTFSPDGRSLITVAGKHDHTLRIWDLASGKDRLAPGRVKAYAYVLAFLPDGKTLAGLRYDGKVWLRDGESGELKQELPAPHPFEGEVNYPMPLALGPAAWLAAIEDRAGRLVLWHPGTDPLRRRPLRLGMPGGGTVTAIALSADGRYVAAGRPDGTICVLRLAERGKVPEIAFHLPDAVDLAQHANAADALKHEDVPEAARAYVSGGDAKAAPPELVAVLGDVRFRCPSWAGRPTFSPDGKLLAVPDGSKRVLLFDPATGRVARTVAASANEALLSPDNKTLAVTSDYQVELWDVAAGRRLHQFAVEDPPMECCRIAFSPDGKLLAAGSGTSQQVRVWEVVGGKERFWWDGSKGKRDRLPIEQVAFSADGTLLAAARRYQEPLFWRLRPDGKFEEVKLGDGLSAVEGAPCIAFSPDGNAVALWDSNKSNVRLCDAQGKLRHSLSLGGCNLLAFTPDSRTLLATKYGENDSNCAVQRIDVATSKPLSAADIPGIKPYTHCTLSPDGQTLAAVRSEYERLVRLHDTATGKLQIPDPGHNRAVWHFAFSPDGKRLVSVGGGQLKLWDLATGKEVRSWISSAGGGGPVEFSPDGRVLAVATGSGIDLRDAGDGKRIHTLSGLENSASVIAFSADGKLLAAGGSDRTVWVWRTGDGKMQRVLNQQARTDTLAFSPDGRFLISLTGEQDYTYRVWDLATGEDRIAPRQVEESAYMLAFLPDGKTLAGVRCDGKVWLRDWQSGDLKQEFPAPDSLNGEKSTPMPLALGPAGRLAATEDRAGQLVVWQPGTNPLRRRILRLGPQGGVGVAAVAFSPDGRYVVAGCPDGTICLLRLAERGQVPEVMTEK